MTLKLKLTALVIALTHALPVFSAQWTLKPILNPSVEYDDNISMSPSDKEGSFKFSIRPTLLGSYQTETSLISLSTGYTVERYSSDTRSTEDNPFFQLNSNKSFERSSLGLNYSFREAASRDTAAEDTGDFSSRTVITTHSISPSYSYSVSEIDSISINFGYTQREYSTDEFRDNETKSVSTSWQRQFSERLNGYTSLSYSNYQSGDSDTGTKNDNYNVSVGANYELSERWSLRGNIGIRYLDTKTGTVSSSNSGSSFDLTAAHQSELGSISFSALRGISPSSTGDVNQQDRLSVNWTRRLNERLSLGISSRYIETTSATESSNNKRENFNISPNLTWNITPKASLKFDYRYRQQKRTNQATAEGNSVNLSFTYDWQGYRISR
jgi:predicted porin